MEVVTSGYKFLDIDAYAGCIAYAELLNLLGRPAIAASTAPLNESITPTIRAWEVDLRRDYVPGPGDSYVLVDISEARFFERFVDPDRVVEVIDHHLGFADYWQDKIGAGAQIEFIGAACTLVYERWKQAGLLEQIDETSARLLVSGILDNTLNLQAHVTDDRDRAAYTDLLRYANLPVDWPAQYFGECQEAVTGKLETTIQGDTKTITYPSLGYEIHASQLAVWGAAALVTDRLADMQRAMEGIEGEWYINVISIQEGKNYLVARGERLKGLLSVLLGVQFGGSVATTDRLWLRKEIMQEALSR